MNKSVFNITIISLMLSSSFCTKQKEDKTPQLLGLAFLSSSQVANRNIAVQANVPVGRRIATTAGGLISQTVNIPNATNSERFEGATKNTVLGSSGTVTIKIFEIDGFAITGCPNVTSAPGANSVTMNCTVPRAGTYITQLVSTASTNLSFATPVGASIVTSAGSSDFQSMDTLMADDPQINVTKNITITGLITRNFLFPQLSRVDPSTKAGSYITDAIVTAKFKTNAEVTLTHFCVPNSVLCGYSNTNSNLIPSGSNPATGGDTLLIKISASDGSWSLQRTLTYPNSISNVRIGGTQLANNTNYTISRASGTTITWDNPTSNVPQVVSVTPGHNIGDVTTFPWAGFFQTAATTGTATITSTQLSAYNTVSTANNTDNCIGIGGSFSGNFLDFPTFYSGPVTQSGTTVFVNSAWAVGNSSGLLDIGSGTIEGLACESVNFSGSTWASSRPRLIVTN